jgi:hypothetical protein
MIVQTGNRTGPPTEHLVDISGLAVCYPNSWPTHRLLPLALDFFIDDRGNVTVIIAQFSAFASNFVLIGVFEIFGEVSKPFGFWSLSGFASTWLNHIVQWSESFGKPEGSFPKILDTPCFN